MISSIYDFFQNINIITLENGVRLKLNILKSTADIIPSPRASGNIFIPCKIKHHLKNYYIKKVCSDAFNHNLNIKSIEFAHDSELQTIESNALAGCSIDYISIPSPFIDFGSNWYNPSLKKMNISITSPNNRFSYLDNEHKIILTKSNKDNDQFNSIFFVNRDIERLIIPPSIEYLCDNSLAYCMNIRSLEFSGKSNLISIGNNALSSSLISNLHIPSKLRLFGHDWCHETRFLNIVTIDPENKYFKKYEKNQKLVVGRLNENEINDNILLFAERNIKEVEIPSFISCISNNCFSWCFDLEKITFQKDSKLTRIKSNAFSFTSINSITIPKNVKIIGKSAFFFCEKLKTIKFEEDSKLEIIKKDAFIYSIIDFIVIPSSVKKIEVSAFEHNNLLKSIEFLSDEIHFENSCFSACPKLFLISFPNAKKIRFTKYSFFKSDTDQSKLIDR